MIDGGRLTLEVDRATTDAMQRRAACLYVYESTVRHAESGAALLSVVINQQGLRLTREQAQELREFIGAWLEGEAV